MPGIYDRHRTAFNNVSAWVVMDGADRVATVAIKYGNAVTAYVHWIGLEMQRGQAGGGGYDRRSAACAHAMRKLPVALPDTTYDDGTPHYDANKKARFAAFRAAMAADDGFGWDRRLQDAGFKVWQAV